MTPLVLVLGACALALWPGRGVGQRLERLSRALHPRADEAEGPSTSGARWARVLRGRGSLGAGAVLAVSALVVGVGPGLVAGAAIIAVAAGRVVRAERAHAERRRGEDDWVGALDSVVAAAEAGASPSAALDGARTSAPPAIAADLSRAVALETLGGDASTVLGASTSLAARRLSEALALARDHGLPLAAVLRRAADEVGEITRHASEIEAALAGPRATALVLTALPLLGVGLGHLMGADPVGALSSGVLGSALAVAGAVFIGAGLLWTSAIISGARS